MALVAIGPGHPRPPDQPRAGRGEGAVARLAANMDPRSQAHIILQRGIGQAQQKSRMDRPAIAVEGQILANRLVIRGQGRGTRVETNLAQHAVGHQAVEGGRRPVIGGRQGHRRDIGDRRQRRLGHAGVAGGAEPVADPHRDRQRAILSFIGGDLGAFAVIDRLDEPRRQPAAFQPSAAPMAGRWMGHIGVNLNTRHQPASEPETARGGVVMDQVFRSLGGIERRHVMLQCDH